MAQKQIFQDIYRLFERIGLKRKEAQIYIVCLQQQDGLFLFEIVERTGIVRSTVDLMVERLLVTGYLTKVQVGRRFKYFAQSAEALVFRHDQLLADLKSVVPLLGKLAAPRGETEVIFLEGPKGFRQAYDYTLLELSIAEGDKRELLSIASGADALKVYPDIGPGFIKKRIQKRIPIRILAPHSAGHLHFWQNDPKELRTVKYFNEKQFPFDMNFEIFGDAISLYSLKPPIGGVLLKNPRLASSMRSFFNMIWPLV